MLVSSAQSSTQRPLGLSVEELFALDRQYRRIEQQQHQLAQLQAQSRATSANLNRLSSRSLDLVSSSSNGFTVLPSLEVHGYAYANRAPPLSSALSNYSRSNSIDQLRYTPVQPPAPVLKSSYQPRSTNNGLGYSSQYSAKYRSNFQVRDDSRDRKGKYETLISLICRITCESRERQLINIFLLHLVFDSRR